jgi:hypothetical protein
LYGRSAEDDGGKGHFFRYHGLLAAVAPSKSRGIFCPLILAKTIATIGDISSGHDDHLITTEAKEILLVTIFVISTSPR